MTPQELRDFARAMREEGIFRVTLPDGIVLEMSQVAIHMGAQERLAVLEAEKPKPAPQQAADETPPDENEEDDPMTYAATEGLPE